MVPNYSSRTQYDRLFALGVTLYGQMTAGSFCYIGPQGIVHGTTVRPQRWPLIALSISALLRTDDSTVHRGFRR